MCVDGNCLPTLHPCARYTCVTTTFPSELLVQSIRNFTGEALIELQEMNLWGKKHLHWPCKTTCCWSFLRSKMAPHKFWSKYFLIKHHQLQFGMDIYIYIPKTVHLYFLDVLLPSKADHQPESGRVSTSEITSSQA